MEDATTATATSEVVAAVVVTGAANWPEDKGDELLVEPPWEDGEQITPFG